MHKKRIVAATAIVALALAFAGIGYALTYTGTTTNTGNTVTSTYIEVGADGYSDKFDKEVYYNTVNNAGTKTYTLNPATPGYAAANTIGDIDAPTVKIGTVTLTITEKPHADGTTYDGYTLAVTHDKAITGTYYIGYKVGDAAVQYETFAVAAEAGYTITGITGAASTTVVIDLYIVVDAAGTTTAPVEKPVNDVTFTFTATATTA